MSDQVARILGNVAAEDCGFLSPCWVWQGAKSNGYGQICWTGFPSKRVHRAAWILMKGPVAAGLHLDHLCRNRACCNPDHLEPVTPKENAQRGMAYDRRKVCRKGHDLSVHLGRRPGNLGFGYCRACQNDRLIEKRAARRKGVKLPDRRFVENRGMVA